MDVEVSVDLQVATAAGGQPEPRQIGRWVSAALAAANRSGAYEVSVRVVDEPESRALNRQYRDKDRATNVLSFPFEALQGLPADVVQPLGDLVICGPILHREASEQGKEMSAHWAHMVVHGTLHLLGYDHQADEQAASMEAQEINVLRKFGIENPYIHTK